MMFAKGDRKPGRLSNGEGLSIIAGDVIITGNVGGSGQLHVEGRIDGDVVCAALTLGASGTIAGHVTADHATIAGTIEGTISAKTLVVEATAQINGDLSYDAVSIASGAIIEGRVKRLTRADGAGGLKLIANE